jgi:hypothetical protein
MTREKTTDSKLHPTMRTVTVGDVVDGVLYLAQFGHISGEILHADGATPARRR